MGDANFGERFDPRSCAGQRPQLAAGRDLQRRQRDNHHAQQATADGSYFLTAFGVNDSGQIVGQGIDPMNAARNVGIVNHIGQNMAFEVGASPGLNGALAFGVSNTGYVVGSSMLNQGSGLPFIWSDQGGMVAIPLASGTTQGSARAVYSAGRAVGNPTSAFSIPFLSLMEQTPIG